MEDKKFSLDVHESTKTMRIFQLIFGIVCIVASIFLLVNIISVKIFSGTNLIAVVFLFLFGIWELLASFGVTGRYIVISGDKIILKDKYLASPAEYPAGSVNTVIFSPLAFELKNSDGKKTMVKLGAFYSERSTEIMQTVESFCRSNNINIEGLDREQ